MTIKNQSIDDVNLLLDNHEDPMAITDLEGKILAINEKLAKIFGKNKEELIGTSGFDNFETKVLTQRRKIVEKVIKNKKPVELIYQEKGRWWKAFLKPIFNDKGNVVKLAYYMLDITGIKEVEFNLKKRENELEDTLLKLTTVTENIKVGLYYTDVKGNFLWANKTAAEIAGRSRKEMIGKNGKYLLDVKSISKKDYLKALKLLTHVKLGKKAGPEEFKIKIKDGVEKIVEIQAQKIKLHDESLIVGIVSDITDRKKAEQEIIDERSRAERYLNLAGTIIVALDSNGNIELLNNKGYEIFGYDIGYLSGKNWFKNCLPKEIANDVKNIFDNLMNGKDEIVDHYENPILRKDGELRLINWYNTLIRDEKGKIIGTLSSGEDITNRKKAEEKIKETKDHLQNVIDSTSEIIFSIGKDFKIKIWNRSAKMITGYTQSRIIGKHVNNLEFFVNLNELKGYINTIFKGKVSTLEEVSINTSFGIKRIFSVSTSFMRDESNNVHEILFVCKDVTYEKERHGRLLFGQSYLVSDVSSDNAVDIFSGMLHSNHPGLYVGRMREDELKNVFVDVSPLVVRLSMEKEKKNIRNRFVCSDFEGLLSIIEGFISKRKRSIVLFDRIEYLIVNSSFESVIENIYVLNEMIRKHNCLLLLRVNPFLLDKTQIAILKEELQELPGRKIDDVQLEEILFEILNYIKIENKRNSLVSYSRIGKQFSISKITTQRRIESLLEKGLIFSKKLGRRKTLYITDKGKNLLTQRTAI